MSEQTISCKPVNPSRKIQVGFYDVGKTIGRGNFAVVKLAQHRITKTEVNIQDKFFENNYMICLFIKVAMKIIDKTKMSQSILEKTNREICILKMLNHKHVVRLYQVHF